MKALRFLSVLLLLCALPLCAFAMDYSYLEKTKWSSTVVDGYIELNSNRFGGELEGGYCQYYIDLSNYCFYLNISYTENSLKDIGDNEIYLNFNIKNESNKYPFIVDKNTDGKVLSNLEVHTSFSKVWLSGQEIYVGIEFLNKEDKKLNNYLKFSLVVNGYEYDLCDTDIELTYGGDEESPTTANSTTANSTTTKTATTNPSTTKESTTKQTTTSKETTTKFKYNYTTTTRATEKETGTTTEKPTEPKTETTTKFKYSGTVTTSTAWNNEQGIFADVNTAENGNGIEGNAADSNSGAETVNTQNGIIIPEASGETGGASNNTPQEKLLTAAAVICAVAGIAFIARGALSKSKTGSDNDDKTDESDEVE